MPSSDRFYKTPAFRLQLAVFALAVTALGFGYSSYWHLQGFFGEMMSEFFWNDFVLMVAAIIIAYTVVAVSLHRYVTQPMKHLDEALQALAEGELEEELPHAQESELVAKLAQAVEGLRQETKNHRANEVVRADTEIRLQQQRRDAIETLAGKFEAQVKHLTSEVLNASQELCASAESLVQLAGNLRNDSGNVRVASGHTNSNVKSMSSATEKMQSAIGRVAHQLNKSTTAVKEILLKTDHYNYTNSKLTALTIESDEEARMLKELANQLSLLSLNASIEAGKSASGGQGFSEVAQQLKNLAKQTGAIASDMEQKMAASRQVSEEMTQALGEIRQLLSTTDRYTARVTMAVDQQKVATAYIARSMQGVAGSSKRVLDKVDSVTRRVDEAAQNANWVLMGARELTEQSENLRKQLQETLASLTAEEAIYKMDESMREDDMPIILAA